MQKLPNPMRYEVIISASSHEVTRGAETLAEAQSRLGFLLLNITNPGVYRAKIVDLTTCKILQETKVFLEAGQSKLHITIGLSPCE